MKRHFVPGRWNRHGRAVPDTRLEMDCNVAPDAERTFSPPPAEPVRSPIDPVCVGTWVVVLVTVIATAAAFVHVVVRVVS